MLRFESYRGHNGSDDQGMVIGLQNQHRQVRVLPEPQKIGNILGFPKLGILAHLVEHRIETPKVPGSKPGDTTMLFIISLCSMAVNIMAALTVN